MSEEASSKKRRLMSSMMSPTSSIWDSMNNPALSGRNSSHESKIGRHGISYCTESWASEARTGLVESTGVSGGGISSGVEGTIA